MLVSLVAEERRGRPGPARDAALASDGSNPAAAVHLLDAVYASLVAGEPRRALALLDQVDTAGQDWLARRVTACRIWAVQLDRNWYPGDVGADLPDDAVETTPTLDAPGAGDPETTLVEAVVAQGPMPLLSGRAVLESVARTAPTAVQPMLGSLLTRLEAFVATARTCGALTTASWGRVAQADLAWRAGLTDVALGALGVVRQALTAGADAVGLACTHIVEGDWWLTPGSSPEAYGYDLPVQSAASPMADRRDLARAEAAYRLAAATLSGASEPRVSGALALRFAYLAAGAGDHDGAASWLANASASFSEAGDAAALHLVTVHGLLLDLARDQIAATRLAAGSGWDLAARGPIAEIRAWAVQHGSASFCTGLGRLLQRAGDAWKTRGAIERAATAYSCAVPLIEASGAVSAGHVLASLADVDAKRGFAARAVVRLEQAVEHLPPVPSPRTRPEGWLEHLDLVMSITGAQTGRVTSSPSPSAIRGLERVLQRLRDLAAVTEQPRTPPAGLREAAEVLQSLRNDRAQQDIDSLVSEAERSPGALAAPFLAQAIPALSGQIATTEILLSLSKGRSAQRAGWAGEADRLLRDALDAAERSGPGQSWLAIPVLVAAGRDEEAKARVIDARAARFLPDDLLASLALRARSFDDAQELFTLLDASSSSALGWVDLLDRAELALELGDPTASLSLATTAIEQFEFSVGRLARDPDRLAATDDVKVPGLYLVACRACLALAQQAGADDPRREQHLGRCFQLADRARSLALMTLVDLDGFGGSGELQRRWQQTATNWSAAFDRLRACYEKDDLSSQEEMSAALTTADDRLIQVEADVEAIDQGSLTRPRLPRPVETPVVRSALPAGACLLEYQLVGRELLVLGVTTSGVTPHYARLEPPGIEALVNGLWRSCSTGGAGPEARQLAHLLLDPVGDLLASHPRVMIVPFGPLTAVPFHVLPFGDGLLGEEHVISYLPSAALLTRSQIDGPLHGRGVVAVGDPAFDPVAHPTLRRLPGAAIEARAAATIHGTDPLLAADAREDAVRPLLVEPSIVHLAAHGRLDEIAPGTSSIVLAGRDELTVGDLIGMRIGAGVVVLSACDSGRGTATLGGDLIGLARGLIAAGVERSVVSLWPVDDVAACVTMAALHRQLAAGNPPAAALASAQREVRGLSAGQIVERYGELGGSVLPGDRSVRRSPGGANPGIPGSRLIALDPEFIDDTDDEPAATDSLDGHLERIWAPFILVGT